MSERDQFHKEEDMASINEAFINEENSSSSSSIACNSWSDGIVHDFEDGDEELTDTPFALDPDSK